MNDRDLWTLSARVRKLEEELERKGVSEMQEARFSLNLRFNLSGFDSQVTVRSDTSFEEALGDFNKAVNALKGLGAVPERRWENGRKNGEEEKPECPKCHKSDRMELIKWQKDGKPKEAWKCQRCNKWLRNGGG